jgi:transcription initiation factor IIF auxiliary subunit
MAIVLNFADKGGTKELTHDLHFQLPSYEILHVIVFFARVMVIIDIAGIPKTKSGVA